MLRAKTAFLALRTGSVSWIDRFRVMDMPCFAAFARTDMHPFEGADLRCGRFEAAASDGDGRIGVVPQKKVGGALEANNDGCIVGDSNGKHEEQTQCRGRRIHVDRYGVAVDEAGPDPIRKDYCGKPLAQVAQLRE